MVKVPGQRRKRRELQDKSKWSAVPVPAIIEKQTWQKAQDRLKVGRAKSKRNSRHEYLIGRRVTCKCGYSVAGKPCHTGKGQVYLYYRCNGKYGDLTSRTCDLPLFSAKQVDAVVWQWVYKLLQKPEKMLKGYREAQGDAQDAIKPLLSELAQVEKMTAEKEGELQRLLGLYLKSSFEIDVLEERKRGLDQALFDLNPRKMELKISLQQNTITDGQIADFVEFAGGVREELEEGIDFKTKRGLLDKLNLQAVLFEEEGEKKIRLTCYAGEEVVSCDGNSL
jgi:site-specific DNA recombinase